MNLMLREGRKQEVSGEITRLAGLEITSLVGPNFWQRARSRAQGRSLSLQHSIVG
jgi:hypothetical protein